MPMFLTLNSFFKTCPKGFRVFCVWALVVFSFSLSEEVGQGEISLSRNK